MAVAAPIVPKIHIAARLIAPIIHIQSGKTVGVPAKDGIGAVCLLLNLELLVCCPGVLVLIDVGAVGSQVVVHVQGFGEVGGPGKDVVIAVTVGDNLELLRLEAVIGPLLHISAVCGTAVLHVHALFKIGSACEDVVVAVAGRDKAELLCLRAVVTPLPDVGSVFGGAVGDIQIQAAVFVLQVVGALYVFADIQSGVVVALHSFRLPVS